MKQILHVLPRKGLAFLFALSAFLAVDSYGQNSIIANPKIANVIVVAQQGNDVIVPLEFDLTNTTPRKLTPKITIDAINDASELINRFSPADFATVKILNREQDISINPGATVAPTTKFILFIPRSVVLDIEKAITIEISTGAVKLNRFTISLQPMEKSLSLDDYIKKSKLDYVVKVESSDNVLTVGGFKKVTSNGQSKDLYQKKKVILESGEVLAIFEGPRAIRYRESLPMSLISIPFKIRPRVFDGITEFKSKATAGITNIGLNLDLAKIQVDRYFSTGKKTTHKLSFGVWAAPSVEDLDSLQTKGLLKTEETSKQLFISSGITISYSYNDISFIFVPAGWDFGTSTIGKNWIYNGKRWWGFGIGISPKIFGSILNK